MKTKTQALKLARQRYGRSATIDERPKALNAEAKEALRGELTADRARIKQLAERLRQIGGDNIAILRELLRAAEFAREVDGQKSAIEVLATASAKATEYLAAIDERRELEKSIRSREGLLYGHRWTVVVVGSLAGLAVHHVKLTADTLDELVEQLEPATV